MSFTELLPVVTSLPHADKVRLLHFLAGAIAVEEGLPDIPRTAEFPIWSPYDEVAAAMVLESALASESPTP